MNGCNLIKARNTSLEVQLIKKRHTYEVREQHKTRLVKKMGLVRTGERWTGLPLDMLSFDMQNFQGNKYTHKRVYGYLLPEHVSVYKKFDQRFPQDISHQEILF